MSWTVDQLIRWLDAVEPTMEQRDLFTWLELPPSATAADIQPAFHAVARNRHPDLYRSKLPHAEFDRLVRLYARIAAAYAELRDPVRCEAYARMVRLKHAPAQAGRAPTPDGPRRATPRGVPLPQVSRTPTPAQVSRAPTPAQVSRTQTQPQVSRTQTQPQVSRTQTGPTPAPQVSRTATQPQVSRTPTQPQVTRAPTGAGGTRAPSHPAGAGAPTEPPIVDDGDPVVDVAPSRAMNARALAYYRRAEGALRVGDHATAMLQLRMALASDPSSALLRAALAELLAHR